jgi:xanthine dehydrogenase accessory factor
VKGNKTGMNIQNNLVVIRGGGDLATGVAYRLMRSGFQVIILEIEKPTVIRRTVAFAEAVYHGTAVVEGIQAIRVRNAEEAMHCLNDNTIPVVVDPAGDTIPTMKPHILVDAILAKRNLGTHLKMAPIVIGLGPGFCAEKDVHAVIETNRGHNLGRVFLEGTAEPDTGVPGVIGGFDYQRILRAPADGVIHTVKKICTRVQCGEVIAYVEDVPVISQLDGVLRGLITDGLRVRKNLKIGDVDPRCKLEYCYSISDKARAIGGGVLEAILYLLKKEGNG